MEMGYTSNLLCSSCRELREFNLQDLEAECDSCCQPDAPSGEDKVPQYNSLALRKRLVFLIGAPPLCICSNYSPPLFQKFASAILEVCG